MGGKLLNFKSFVDNAEEAVKFLAAVNGSEVPFKGPVQNLIYNVLLANEINDTFYVNARSSDFSPFATLGPILKSQLS